MGAGGVFIKFYLNPITGKWTVCVLVGCEKGGSYAGQYNLTSGHFDRSKDKNDYDTLRRETGEELGEYIKKLAQFPSVADPLFRIKNGDINSTSGGTPIWLFELKEVQGNGISRSKFKSTDEISSIDFLPLDALVQTATNFHNNSNTLSSSSELTARNIDGISVPVSSFLLEVIHQLNVKGCLDKYK